MPLFTHQSDNSAPKNKGLHWICTREPFVIARARLLCLLLAAEAVQNRAGRCTHISIAGSQTIRSEDLIRKDVLESNHRVLSCATEVGGLVIRRTRSRRSHLRERAVVQNLLEVTKGCYFSRHSQFFHQFVRPCERRIATP